MPIVLAILAFQGLCLCGCIVWASHGCLEVTKKDYKADYLLGVKINPHLAQSHNKPLEYTALSIHEGLLAF